ncbi:Poly [ADP-ribose] polymerase 3 [Camelus dromedarius]|uniref:Poly [ADP-ribose] polymerase n=1 Tax=Camelus dromedarius TaxID=9838 RepID=A0A5N4CYV7_CAMDR|nr:Poly [ADP-ribose] polymerase 3 [Camelus dromedarius]
MTLDGVTLPVPTSSPPQGNQFQAHSKLGNQKLLWHGTNMAAVAAILTSGLRIMPHSGGRVGKGIYFAPENSKSASCATGMSCGAHHIDYMFLGEVALGTEYHFTDDKPSLKQPPACFNSDTELELDGQQVAVPQGQPVPCPEFSSSSFSQSEYLIYQESQCHLRYLQEVRF